MNPSESHFHPFGCGSDKSPAAGAGVCVCSLFSSVSISFHALWIRFLTEQTGAC